jgi:ABC-2 type transport system permease protein
MNPHVRLAIFRRNFSSYFANPTGYVFICVFVLLSSIAAFWPNEFFTANLANLDQLNKYFPLIMLIFIPAITMSIWAEERRQGTDELLLTIPATDFDVVLGKYMAAVGIYGVSLVFSFICNFAVLKVLGDPDLGLLISTYLGYLLVGMAMLSIGMVASFLTNNITVGFVLGAMFNAIPVGLTYADTVLPVNIGLAVKEYGIAARLRDFTQGVVSLSSVAYLLAIVVVMLYLSMVLIGRRHWAGGRDGVSLAPHYAFRTLGLVATVVGLFWVLRTVPVRSDLSFEGLSSLDAGSKQIIGKLDAKRPIHIEAFISPSVPEQIVPIRLDLLTRLQEIAAYGGKNVTLRINETEPFSEQSDRAEKLYGIVGRDVVNVQRGQASQEKVFMGVALTSGLDKLVIPYVDQSTPIEYELVRSIATLNGAAKKRLGVMAAAGQFQEYDPDRMGRLKDPEITAELKKQYDVFDVDMGKAVADDVDVLLAIQPSSWQPAAVDNLVAAIRRGVPTLICEDPQAEYFPNLGNPQQQQMPFMDGTDTQKIWNLLGIEVNTTSIVYHGYNPMKQSPDMPPEIVFVGNGALGNAPGVSLFDEADPISAKTQELVFMFPGWITKKDSKLKFTPLVRTTKVSGYVNKFDLFTNDPFGGRNLNERRRRNPTAAEYVLAARIQGPAPALDLPIGHPLADEKADGTKPADAASAPKNEVQPAASASATPSAGASATAPAAAATPTAKASAAAKPAAPTKAKDMDVVVITDVDLLSTIFYRLRSQRQTPGEPVLNFDNVAFVLNALDVLAGDTRFVDVRKRRPQFRTLKTLDEINQAATDRMIAARNDYEKKFQEELDKEKTRLDDELAKLRNDTKLKQIDKESRLEIFEKDVARRVTAKEQQLNLRREKQQKEQMRELSDEIRRQQSLYKWCAVALPPIPPLVIGLIVFFNRRAKEQEGVSRTRLK